MKISFTSALKKITKKQSLLGHRSCEGYIRHLYNTYAKILIILFFKPLRKQYFQKWQCWSSVNWKKKKTNHPLRPQHHFFTVSRNFPCAMKSGNISCCVIWYLYCKHNTQPMFFVTDTEPGYWKLWKGFHKEHTRKWTLIINTYMQMCSCTSTYFVYELMYTQWTLGLTCIDIPIGDSQLSVPSSVLSVSCRNIS